MTNEEADELIAELEEAFKNDYKIGWDLNMPHAVISGMKESTRKIVKRFANKPPYVYTQKEHFQFSISDHLNDRYFLEIKDYLSLVDIGLFITKENLIGMRDNCNKMLEYIEVAKSQILL